MTPPETDAAPRAAAGAEVPEASRRRMRRLLGDAEAEGLVRALAAPPAALARRWPGAFDAVLLDAPCSDEGMFRKSEKALRAWS